jgi:hypothetical protein
MNNQQTRLASAFQQCGTGFDRTANKGDVIAKGFAKTTAFNKVALHINHHECGGGGIELKVKRLSFNRAHKRSLLIRLSLECTE